MCTLTLVSSSVPCLRWCGFRHSSLLSGSRGSPLPLRGCLLFPTTLRLAARSLTFGASDHAHGLPRLAERELRQVRVRETEAYRGQFHSIRVGEVKRPIFRLELALEREQRTESVERLHAFAELLKETVE